MVGCWRSRKRNKRIKEWIILNNKRDEFRFIGYIALKAKCYKLSSIAFLTSSSAALILIIGVVLCLIAVSGSFKP